MHIRFKARSSRWFLLFVVLFITVGWAGAQDRNKPLFKQDLQSLGYKFKYGNEQLVNSTDLAFLSEDLLLVSVRELTREELHYTVLPSGVAMYDNPSGASTSPTSLSTLFLFNVTDTKAMRSAKLPVRKIDRSIWPGTTGNFLMLSGYGLQRCSSDFVCTKPHPTDGPLYVSPTGNTSVVGGSQFTEQQLVDSESLATVKSFPPRQPKIIPGNVGFVLEDQKAVIRMPGSQDVDPGLVGSHTFPETRFVTTNTVIGVKMHSIAEGTAAVVNVDGTMLYEIPVKDAWRGHTHFIPCASGSRFAITELYYTRVNSMVNFFDIGDTRAYNRARIRVFDVASGKQVFELSWDPRGYRGENILPALSPSGRRLALIRKGELRIFQIP